MVVRRTPARLANSCLCSPGAVRRMRRRPAKPSPMPPLPILPPIIFPPMDAFPLCVAPLEKALGLAYAEHAVSCAFSANGNVAISSNRDTLAHWREVEGRAPDKKLSDREQPIEQKNESIRSSFSMR